MNSRHPLITYTARLRLGTCVVMCASCLTAWGDNRGYSALGRDKPSGVHITEYYEIPQKSEVSPKLFDGLSYNSAAELVCFVEATPAMPAAALRLLQSELSALKAEHESRLYLQQVNPELVNNTLVPKVPAVKPGAFVDVPLLGAWLKCVPALNQPTLSLEAQVRIRQALRWMPPEKTPNLCRDTTLTQAVMIVHSLPTDCEMSVMREIFKNALPKGFKLHIIFVTDQAQESESPVAAFYRGIAQDTGGKFRAVVLK